MVCGSSDANSHVIDDRTYIKRCNDAMPRVRYGLEIHYVNSRINVSIDSLYSHPIKSVLHKLSYIQSIFLFMHLTFQPLIALQTTCFKTFGVNTP